MQLLRYIVFPFTPFYYLITWFRNVLYNQGVKSYLSYDFPLICVGNLSTGGTGKSPMIEYLIRLLKSDYQIATLSRGYGRQTKGFVLGDDSATATQLGDEPFQFFLKYGKDIAVSVCEDRQKGIAKLLQLKPKPNIVLLDDAFQHRKVKAGFNILLTTYSNLYTDDWVLPLGNLREPRSGAERAQIIVVTKCPLTLNEEDKLAVTKKINPNSNQSLFFSKISYPDAVIGLNKTMALESLSNFTLVTGIANAKPLVTFLKTKGLVFNHIEFKDHYNFTEKSISKLSKEAIMLTTEKDYTRLKAFKSIADKLYYLPIEVTISDQEKFDGLVKDYVAKTL